MGNLKTVNKSKGAKVETSNIAKIEQQIEAVESEITPLELMELELSNLDPNCDEFMELEAQIEALKLASVVKVEKAKSYFLGGSNQLLLAIYNATKQGKAIHLFELWDFAKNVKNSAGEPKPFTWNAFTRTWNTSTLTLAKNKVENAKNEGNFGEISEKGKVLKRELETIGFVESMNKNINNEKVKDIFGKFANENGKIEVKIQVISEILTPQTRKGIPNKTQKLGNKFKIYGSSMELVKTYLISKGAQAEQFEA